MNSNLIENKFSLREHSLMYCLIIFKAIMNHIESGLESHREKEKRKKKEEEKKKWLKWILAKLLAEFLYNLCLVKVITND